MKRVAVVTVGRSDYGLYRPILEAMAADPELEPVLIVSGAHLLPSHGDTQREIEADGFPIAARVEMLTEDDSPASAAAAIARGVAGFAAAYEQENVDLVLVLGDRFEMLAAAVAALPLTIPVAHIHGGEVTEGAFDDASRHAITKLSHLHFPATEEYARRIVTMGEDPSRVVVSGAPGLDNVAGVGAADGETPVSEPFVLVTWHPVSLAADRGEAQLAELLAALGEVDMGIVFTHPNADPGRAAALEAIEGFVSGRDNAVAIASLGTREYFGLMRRAAAMVGNSSSGIIEAASFELPVVNVGERQRGRVRAANVIDVEPTREAIAEGIAHATSRAFKESLARMSNPYGDGHAAERIAATLRDAPPAEELIVKRFYEAK